MTKLNYKRKVAKVVALLTAFSFALYGSLPVGTQMFGDRTSEIQTVSAANGSAGIGYNPGDPNKGATYSNGWGTNNALFLKVFPADVDAAANSSTVDDRYGYEKYSIFIPISKGHSGSICLDQAYNNLKFFSSLDTDGNYTYKSLSSDFLYYGSTLAHSGNPQTFNFGNSNNNFDKFIDSFSALSAGADSSTAIYESCLNQAKAVLSNDTDDSIYSAYMNILRSKHGDAVAQEVEKELYDQESTTFRGERKFTLIVEPMTDVCNSSIDSIFLTDLYTYSQLLSYPTASFKALYAKPLWSAFFNTSSVAMPSISEATPAWAYKSVYAALSQFVPVVNLKDDKNPVLNNIQNFVEGMHCGWTWFNIAGSEYAAPTTYNIVETATLDVSSGNDIFQNLSFESNGQPVSVRDAIYERTLTNKDIVQNYYRRTTALTEEQWKSADHNGLVKVMSSIAGRMNVDENAYALVDYNGATEERKKNPENANFFLSISPVANFDSDVFNLPNLSFQKKDYILSNDGKISTTDASMLNPTGSLNYEPVLSYEEMTKGNNALYAAVQNKSNIIKGADFELSGIKVTATCYDTKTEQFDGITYNTTDGKTFEASNGTVEWVIPKDKILSKFTDTGYINLVNSAFISEPDLNGNTIALHKWFQLISANENQKFANKHFTIEVRYLYNQGEIPDKPFEEYTEQEAGGKFETEIPQYAVNQPYSSILDTENLSVYDKNRFTVTYEDKPYVMGGNAKATNNALIQAPTIAECLVDPFYTGYLFKSFSPFTNPYSLETLVNSKNSRFIFEPKTSDDVDLYNSFRLNFERVPYANKTFTHLNAFTYLKWASMANPVISQNLSNDLSLDSSFIVSKNPAKDKIVVADWCDQSETAYNSGSRGVSSDRTVTGLYTIHTDPLKLSGKEITVKAEMNKGTLSCEGKTETKNAERSLIIADSTYDTVCKIKNYAAKQNPNDTSFNYPAKPELTVDEDSNTRIYGVPESTVNFIPEVPMLYYPDPESGPATLIVQSNQNREIKMVNYHEIDCDLNTNVSTSGMLPATDTRASSLRRSFGDVGENAPVLYGGSDVVNVVANNESKLTFRSYVLDVDSGSKAVVSQNGKSADTVASDWLNQYLHDKNQVTVSVTGKNSVYSSWDSDTPVSTYNLEPYDLNFVADTSDASYGVPTVYDLVVKDGRVTDILLNGAYVGRNDSIWEAVQNMKLNELFGATLETTRSKNNTSDAVNSADKLASLTFDLFYHSGNSDSYRNLMSKFTDHWYGEGSSIFKLKVYETSFKSSDSTQLTNKIPLNAGPASVSSKNAFSSGYGVYVGFEAALKGANGTFKISEDKKKADSKISYIIPDQTVNDISH